jgi:hypothetical protein
LLAALVVRVVAGGVVAGRRRIGIVVAVACLSASLAGVVLNGSPAGAVNPTIVVQDSGDGAPNPADCSGATPASCSLRDAFAKASADAGDDVIDVQVGTATITINTHLDYVVNEGLTIHGNGSSLTISGSDRLMDLSGSTGPFAFDHMTFRDSDISSFGFGAAMSVGGPITLTSTTFSGFKAQRGGAINAQSTVTVVGSTFQNNHAIAGQFSDGEGGAIFSGGAVTVTGSTFSGNEADDEGGAINTTLAGVTVTGSTFNGNSAHGAGGGGGAIYAGDAAQPVRVTSSTLSGNVADGSLIPLSADAHAAAASGSGGAIFTDGTVTVTNSTISGNNASSLGGGVATFPQIPSAPCPEVDLVYSTVVSNSAPTGANIGCVAVTLTSVGAAATSPVGSFGSVVALPLGGGTNCVGAPLGTLGYNYSDDASCGLTAGTDTASGADPKLGALADNGGTTRTRLPQTGSPLIDAIPIAHCSDASAAAINPLVDQIGTSRPQGNGCEIGAVEVVVAAPVVPVPVVIVPTFTG